MAEVAHATGPALGYFAKLSNEQKSESQSESAAFTARAYRTRVCFLAFFQAGFRSLRMTAAIARAHLDNDNCYIWSGFETGSHP